MKYYFLFLLALTSFIAGAQPTDTVRSYSVYNDIDSWKFTISKDNSYILSLYGGYKQIEGKVQPQKTGYFFFANTRLDKEEVKWFIDFSKQTGFVHTKVFESFIPLLVTRGVETDTRKIKNNSITGTYKRGNKKNVTTEIELRKDHTYLLKESSEITTK